jgi:hypothetical protein
MYTGIKFDFAMSDITDYYDCDDSPGNSRNLNYRVYVLKVYNDWQGIKKAERI